MNDGTPAEHPIQQTGLGKGGIAPPLEYRWKKGESGNPKGRPSAGAAVKEWVNAIAAADLTEDAIREIARDRKSSWARRTAAERMLQTLGSGDLADFEPFLQGDKSLAQLREEGFNTELLRKAKITDKGGREIELRDTSGNDFDRIMDRTEGKPTQTVDVSTQHIYEGEEMVLVTNAHERVHVESKVLPVPTNED